MNGKNTVFFWGEVVFCGEKLGEYNLTISLFSLTEFAFSLERHFKPIWAWSLEGPGQLNGRGVYNNFMGGNNQHTGSCLRIVPKPAGGRLGRSCWVGESVHTWTEARKSNPRPFAWKCVL